MGSFCVIILKRNIRYQNCLYFMISTVECFLKNSWKKIPWFSMTAHRVIKITLIFFFLVSCTTLLFFFFFTLRFYYYNLFNTSSIINKNRLVLTTKSIGFTLAERGDFHFTYSFIVPDKDDYTNAWMAMTMRSMTKIFSTVYLMIIWHLK